MANTSPTETGPFDLGQAVEIVRTGSLGNTPAEVVGWNGPFVLVRFTHPKGNNVTELVRPRNLQAF